MLNSPRHYAATSTVIRLASLLALVAALVAFIAPAQAQDTHSWNDPSGGVYGTLTRWSPVGIPSSLDTTVFDLDADYTVSFLQSQAAEELRVENGAVTFQGAGIFIGDRTYAVNNATIGGVTTSSLYLDSATSGHRMNLVVNDSLDVTRSLQVLGGSAVQSGIATVNPTNAGITATAIVRGTDASGVASRWDTTNLEVGEGRDGTLIVDEGGIMAAEEVSIGAAGGGVGAGRVNIRGTATDGSPSMFSATGGVGIGVGSSGHLSVTDGAFAHTPGLTLIGTSAASGSGRVEGVDASGTPSRWTAGSFTVARGMMQVKNGGILTSTDSTVGTAAGNTSRVLIGNDDIAEDGAFWTVDGTLIVSDGASAHLAVLAGARLTSGKTLIGADATGTGELGLGNVGETTRSSWTSSSDVWVGGDELAEGGTGILSLFENSQAEIAGKIKIWGTGQVTLASNTQLTSDQIVNTDGGSFNFNGGVLQTNRFEGNLDNTGGTLAPGPDAGSTTIIGDYSQQADATLAIDIGGTTAGVSHDLVNISGNALLDGTLALSLINGFTPGISDEFTALVSDGIFDSFDNVLNGQRLETIDGRGSFAVNYGIGSAFEESRIVLSDFMAMILSGDYDGNGLVGAGDLNLVLGAWGEDVTATGIPSGWINEQPTGLISAAELNVVLNNWGTGLTMLAAVPEPSAAFPVLFGLAGFVRSKRWSE